MYDIEVYESIYDELRQGPGPDLGPRLNGYGDRTIMGTGHYGDRLISGPAIIGTGSLVACNDRSGPENDTLGPETRGAVPKMIPPVPKREERSRFFCCIIYWLHIRDTHYFLISNSAIEIPTLSIFSPDTLCTLKLHFSIE